MPGDTRPRNLIVGNSSVSLALAVKNRNTQVVNEASPNLLTSTVTAGESPDFLQENYLTVTQLFSTVNDPGLQIMYESLDEDERPDTIQQFFDNQRDYPQFLLRSIFKLFRGNSASYMTTLMLGNSMMELIAPGFLVEAIAVFGTLKINHEVCSLTEFLEIYPELKQSEPFDIRDYRKIHQGHYIFAASLFVTLIGKGLNSSNYMGWMLQRSNSFSRPLGMTASDSKLIYLRPSLAIAIKFYDEVRIHWRIRALYFWMAWSMAQQGDLRAKGMRVTINLLRHAEMTNFQMILVWILGGNDILLGWNELGKYTPYLCAAYSKYCQLGPMADWAKMILPQEEVTEFAAAKLQILFSVARAISARYGSASANQIEGTNKNANTEKIIQHALKIVAVAGGARTIDTMALRSWRLNGYDNKMLIKELDTGALEEPVEEFNQAIAPEIDQRIS